MPTPTYTALANITLGSSASSVTFSSIPATFRDLILVCDYTGSTTAVVNLYYNNDTGANYSTVTMVGGSTVQSFTGTTLNVGAMYGSNKNTTIFQVMDYSATDKHKTSLQRNNNAQQSEVVAVAGRWANTSAINEIDIITASGTLSSGSTFALYGIAS